MRNANIMTRNTMDLVKKGLGTIFTILSTVTGSPEAQDARDLITLQRGKMDTDATDHGGKYMSQRFKYNRIPPIIKALTKYVLSLKGSDNFKRAQEIITEYNLYIEEIHAARLEMFSILRRRDLVPDLGMPGQSVQEETEAYEVFITKTINTYVPTQAFPSAFPERIGGMNMSNNERNNNYSTGSNEEDPREQNMNNQVFRQITNAMKRSGRIKDGEKTGLGGGKRKQTRKRSSKKSKKSKKTKRIKKVKRTMKKNKGKKGKKASRKRR